MAAGFWVSWWPFAIPQMWPFAYWVVVVVDHFSRKSVGHGVFRKQPTSEEVCGVLDNAIAQSGKPKYIISDKGGQFWARLGKTFYETWCEERGIKPRFGAIGKHGSIAVVERFIRSLKHEFLLRRTMPLALDDIARDVGAYCDWYNRHRPHQTLGGETPDERWRGVSARAASVFEPRARYPDKGRILAAPKGTGLEGDVTPFRGYSELPVIEVRRAA